MAYYDPDCDHVWREIIDENGTALATSCNMCGFWESKPDAIQIGQEITFRAVTRHSGTTVTRIVRDLLADGRPLVKYHGWPLFIVNWDEIKT